MLRRFHYRPNARCDCKKPSPFTRAGALAPGLVQIAHESLRQARARAQASVPSVTVLSESFAYTQGDLACIAWEESLCGRFGAERSASA